eukprot:s708_g27.t1
MNEAEDHHEDNQNIEATEARPPQVDVVKRALQMAKKLALHLEAKCHWKKQEQGRGWQTGHPETSKVLVVKQALAPKGRRNFLFMDSDKLQDNAADGSPEEAGAVLGLLRRVGLVGAKLDLQVGEEECLAKQLDRWPRRQRIDDATEAMEKAKTVEASASSQASGTKGPGKRATAVLPARGKMRKIPRAVDSAGHGGEDREEAKILRILQDELKIMAAPVLQSIWVTSDPERARRALLGKYRPSTVRRYLAYWQGFKLWVERVTNQIGRSI